MVNKRRDFVSAEFMEAKDWGDLATWRRNDRAAAE